MTRKTTGAHRRPAVSLILIAAGLAAIFAAGLLSMTQPALAQDDSTPAPTEDHSSESCADCHVDVKETWANGVHAIAFARQSFQEQWAASNKNPACLQCHTTNYQPATGHYDAENIQCEACHGQNPADHPPARFVVATDASICGDCHTQTFDEWRRSLHAFNPDMGAVGCATCHDPHGQTIRFDTVNDLCLNCHQDNPDHSDPYVNTYVHLTHNEVDLGDEVKVTCISCHMPYNSDDAIHNLPDHSMAVTTRPCTDCHETLSKTGASTTLINVDEALATQRDELRVRVNDLETQLAATQEEASTAKGPNYVQLVQGLIIGLGIGITALWVLLRRENGHNGRPSNGGSS